MTKPIYLMCLHERTGGPEAMHQLSDALLDQGHDARLVYYEPADVTGIAERDGKLSEYVGIPKQFPDHKAPSFEEYARYKINPVRSIDVSEPCVVVLPETMAHFVRMFPEHVTVLVWWLSVDNAFGALSRINLNHLRKPNIKHAAQSVYAAGFIDALGLESLGMLSDYTADLSEYATPLPMSERPKLVAYNANRKVTADWDAIKAEIASLYPEVECVPVRGSRQDVADLFARARVYVDLGCFPGKDRMPREAAVMGCGVITSRYGGAGEDDMGFAQPPPRMSSVRDIAVRVLVEVDDDEDASVNFEHERATFNEEVAVIFDALGVW